MGEQRLITLAREIDSRYEQDVDSAELLAQSAAELAAEDFAELARAERVLGLLERTRQNLHALNADTNELFGSESLRYDDDTTIITGPNHLKKKQSGGKAATTATPATDEQLTQETLGRFEIQRVLGQGGFARVFLARDPQLDRLVALKLPLPETLDDDRARKRFEREARAAAVLSHPAIVPIFETGEVGPVTYIAMGYCPGPTLSQWFADHDRTIPPRTAASIVARLAEAAEHAHQRGIVHRDLKPGNVLLEEQNGNDEDVARRVRITDFGLARLASNRDETLTIEGTVVGTPAYMSPEQARGEANVSPPGDLFSLGSILYELITGQRPFKRDSHLATLRAIENEAPTAPRERNSQIPKDLESICLKCLRKEPSSRYESAYELSADLERFLRGETVKARPATRLERVMAWRRRNPALAMATALGVLAFSMGLAGTTWQWREAQTNLANTQEEFERTQRVAAFLGRTYRSTDPTMDGRDVKVVDVLDRSLQEIEVEFADDPTMRWELTRQIAKSYSGLGLVEKTRTTLQTIYDEFVASGDPADLLSISMLSDLAESENYDGNFDQAAAHIELALEQATSLWGPDDPRVIGIVSRQARYEQNRGNRQLAIDLYDQVVRAHRRDPNTERVKALTAELDLGRALRAGQLLDKAKPLLARVLEELEIEAGPDHPATIAARTEYVNCLPRDDAGAIQLRRDILASAAAVHGDKHPTTLQAMSNLATVLALGGDLEESAKTFEQCIAGSKETFGEGSPFTMVAIYGFGCTLEKMSDFDAACDQFQTAYDGFLASIGEAHPRTKKAQKKLARMLEQTGRTEELAVLRDQMESEAE